MCGKFCKQCTKLCSYGIVIWGVAFIVASVFVGFKINYPVLAQGVTTLAVVTTAFFLAKALKPLNMAEALKHGACWVLVGLALDALITTRFTGWEFLYSLEIWLSYLLVLLAPLLAVVLGKKSQ